MAKTGRKPLSLEEAFWRRVEKGDGCWAWIGAVSPKGYGHVEFSMPFHRIMRAHRASWTIHFGEIAPGMCVLHRCDNPRCVRPDHLFLGTNDDNVQDKVKKQRQVKGTAHYCAKLTEEQVRAIRAEHIPGLAPGKSRVGSIRYLAKKYRVGFRAIQGIIHRKTWKHVH